MTPTTCTPRLTLPFAAGAWVAALLAIAVLSTATVSYAVYRAATEDLALQLEQARARAARLQASGAAALAEDGPARRAELDGALARSSLAAGSLVAVLLAAAAVLLARGFRRIRAHEALALRDALTHAYNRRFLDEVLPKLVHQSVRSKSPLSALMIDVDRFKQVNDRHGHEAGDRILAAVAGCLAEQVRMSDTLVRYGGEEFAVLLPNTSLSNATVLAQRIREAVARTRTVVRGCERPLSVTVSVGAAALERGAGGEQLLVAADRALLHAKRTGRNRVVAWTADRLEERLLAMVSLAPEDPAAASTRSPAAAVSGESRPAVVA